MDRRSFLRGLLALPFAPLAAKVIGPVAQRVEGYTIEIFPWMGAKATNVSSPFLGDGIWKQAIHKYAPKNASASAYGESATFRYIRTGSWPD